MFGKPEPLKYDWLGFWGRRINDEHRLVYTWPGQSHHSVSMFFWRRREVAGIIL
jgi:Txe/YoeB family toxin of toxin-antitoxin system